MKGFIVGARENNSRLSSKELLLVGVLLIAIMILTACSNVDTLGNPNADRLQPDELTWQGISPGITTIEEMLAIVGESDFIDEPEVDDDDATYVYNYYNWSCMTYPGQPQQIALLVIGPMDGEPLPGITRDIEFGDSFSEVVDKFAPVLVNLDNDYGYGHGYWGIINTSYLDGDEVKEVLYATTVGTLRLDFDRDDLLERIEINWNGVPR